VDIFGLKIPRGQLRVGSIPTSVTSKIKGLADLANPFFVLAMITAFVAVGLFFPELI
jgi:hypothetical protein